MQNLASRSLVDDVLKKVNGLKPIADELGVPLSQLAIAWCASNPNVSSVITGATKEAQVSIGPYTFTSLFCYKMLLSCLHHFLYPYICPFYCIVIFNPGSNDVFQPLRLSRVDKANFCYTAASMPALKLTEIIILLGLSSYGSFIEILYIMCYVLENKFTSYFYYLL